MTTPPRMLMAAALANALGLCACATSTPGALVKARHAYSTASQGPAAVHSPTELHAARTSLDRANQSCADHGDTQECQDLAYVARRKVELADISAKTKMDQDLMDAAVTAATAARERQAQEAQAALDAMRVQVNAERQQRLAMVNALLGFPRGELAHPDCVDVEHAGTYGGELADSDLGAAQVETSGLTAAARVPPPPDTIPGSGLNDLAEVALIKEEPRGLVITLFGNALFLPGKPSLLHSAMTKLDKVAAALKAQDLERRIVVEGHSDMQGTESTTLPLSFQRAASVREYLIAQGIKAERIGATGLGSESTFAGHGGADSHANNGRVDIVLVAPVATAQ